MIFFINKKITEELSQLGLYYATDLKVEYRKDTFFLKWSNKSYLLATNKLCRDLMDLFNNQCEFEYFTNALVISRVEDKEKFYKKLKRLNAKKRI